MPAGTLNETTPLAMDSHAEMEEMYITEYLKRRGCSLADLARLPGEVAKALLAAATIYASLRLAELEVGSVLVSALHHDNAMNAKFRPEPTGINQPVKPEPAPS